MLGTTQRIRESERQNFLKECKSVLSIKSPNSVEVQLNNFEELYKNCQQNEFIPKQQQRLSFDELQNQFESSQTFTNQQSNNNCKKRQAFQEITPNQQQTQQEQENYIQQQQQNVQQMESQSLQQQEDLQQQQQIELPRQIDQQKDLQKNQNIFNKSQLQQENLFKQQNQLQLNENSDSDEEQNIMDSNVYSGKYPLIEQEQNIQQRNFNIYSEENSFQTNYNSEQQKNESYYQDQQLTFQKKSQFNKNKYNNNDSQSDIDNSYSIIEQQQKLQDEQKYEKLNSLKVQEENNNSELTDTTFSESNQNQYYIEEKSTFLQNQNIDNLFKKQKNQIQEDEDSIDQSIGYEEQQILEELQLSKMKRDMQNLAKEKQDIEKQIKGLKIKEKHVQSISEANKKALEDFNKEWDMTDRDFSTQDQEIDNFKKDLKIVQNTSENDSQIFLNTLQDSFDDEYWIHKLEVDKNNISKNKQQNSQFNLKKITLDLKQQIPTLSDEEENEKYSDSSSIEKSPQNTYKNNFQFSGKYNSNNSTQKIILNQTQSTKNLTNQYSQQQSNKSSNTQKSFNLQFISGKLDTDISELESTERDFQPLNDNNSEIILENQSFSSINTLNNKYQSMPTQNIQQTDKIQKYNSLQNNQDEINLNQDNCNNIFKNKKNNQEKMKKTINDLLNNMEQIKEQKKLNKQSIDQNSKKSTFQTLEQKNPDLLNSSNDSEQQIDANNYKNINEEDSDEQQKNNNYYYNKQDQDFNDFNDSYENEKNTNQQNQELQISSVSSNFTQRQNSKANLFAIQEEESISLDQSNMKI